MVVNIQSMRFLAIICLVLGISFNSVAQNLWMKYYDNPVMIGDPYSWYGNLSAPSVISDQDTFKMWFRGYTTGLNQQIGYAWSLNGWDWDMDTLPVILVGSPGAWDESKTPGRVIRMNDTLKMWYLGTPDNDVYQTGYAWALDERNWHLNQKPVLTPGPPGSWDDKYVCGGTVAHDGAMYHMYYLGKDNIGDEGIGYAWSNNGTDWTKYPGNPILGPSGTSGSYYHLRLIPSSIHLKDSTVYLYVAGYDVNGYVRIGYFVTEQGNWTNLTVGSFGQPVLDVGASGAWDDRRVTLPSVVEKNDSLYMWYEGKRIGVILRKIGLATDFVIPHPTNCLPDGILFSTQAEIDSFQFNYPYCTDIEGGVIIRGADISNFYGLNMLTSIGGNMTFGGPAGNSMASLNQLDGFENLSYIGRKLTIGNCTALDSIKGFVNLITIDSSLIITSNPYLSDIASLANINLINGSLRIAYNPYLTKCHIQSICNYLSNPMGEIDIHDNAIGCSSQEEVQDSCDANAVLISERYILENFTVNPNPFTTSTTLTYALDEPTNVIIYIFNPQGQLIEKIEQEQSKGEQQVQWKAEGLSAGMYYFRIKADDKVGGCMMIKY